MCVWMYLSSYVAPFENLAVLFNKLLMGKEELKMVGLLANKP